MEVLQKNIESINECAVVFIEKNGKVLLGLRNYSKDNSVRTAPDGRGELGEY